MLALLIIGSLIGTFLLAFIIVKFVPLKLRGLVSILLLALAGYLTFLIYSGVMEPIKFDIEKKKRYAKVIDKLKLIREAQIKYKDVKNTYASNKDSLIYFIEKDSTNFIFLSTIFSPILPTASLISVFVSSIDLSILFLFCITISRIELTST